MRTCVNIIECMRAGAHLACAIRHARALGRGSWRGNRQVWSTDFYTLNIETCILLVCAVSVCTCGSPWRPGPHRSAKTATTNRDDATEHPTLTSSRRHKFMRAFSHIVIHAYSSWAASLMACVTSCGSRCPRSHLSNHIQVTKSTDPAFLGDRLKSLVHQGELRCTRPSPRPSGAQPCVC